MSYMRPLCPYEYIEGESDGDYIFNNGTDIENYGGIKTETALDILFKQFSLIKEKDIDKDIILHCLKRICNNLNIKVRDKPLSFEEWNKLYYNIHERFRKEKCVKSEYQENHSQLVNQDVIGDVQPSVSGHEKDFVSADINFANQKENEVEKDA